MNLNVLWFILIGVLYIGYFILEGFDMGVGILLPILGTDDVRRRVIINTIGPHWDGNEVWLLTAGGATFAAFPDWYATLFSGLYLPLFIILMALIVRGVAFEFRSKDENSRWRSLWDWCIFAGSLIPAFLWGVAFANFVRGLPIDGNMMYVGGFWNLLNWYALLGGLVSLSGFILYGAVFLSLKTTGELRSASERMSSKLWVPNLVFMVAFMIASLFVTDFIARLGINPGPIPIGAGLALLLVGYFIRTKRTGWAFGMMMLTILFAVTTIFLTLFPRVMISSLNPADYGDRGVDFHSSCFDLSRVDVLGIP
jgi:cytochrome d ubiquinol oxidase subunit II